MIRHRPAGRGRLAAGPDLWFSFTVDRASLQSRGVVLVVDDLPRNLQILGSILAPRHFEVLLADNGATALHRIGVRRPDLILLDLMMPGLDGLQVCRRLKGDPATADIPVVFLTAAQDAETAADALGRGAVDYITKPFDTAELVARVGAHVGLKRARDELQRTILEKNDLMSAVAHDLKNPVVAMRDTALRLREQGLTGTEPRGELVDEIVASCEGVLEFIQDRLERNAREFGMESLVIQPCGLAEVLDVVLLHNVSAAAKKGITIVLERPAGDPLRVQGHPGAVTRVLNNLVSNAVKFSPPGRRVRLAARTDVAAGRVGIEVLDEGPGLTAEDEQLLFTPYRRLSAQPTGGESSTGLGLSISRQLTEKMQGKIGYTARPEGGACFWLHLPAAAAAGPARDGPEAVG
jgi:two-component system sensor histidine kinase/response regulator